MRALRYLGVLAKTGLIGAEADNFLEKVKSMPDLLGQQERFFLIQYGVSFSTLTEHTKDELLDMLKSLGRDLYIAESTKLIKDESEKRKKVKELMLRLGRVKVIFNHDVDKVVGIVSKFARYRCFNKMAGFGEYCKTMEEDGLRIESKTIEGEEYFVVS